MRDRETVIKALEHCSRRLGCNTCPYDHGCGRQSLLLEDAAKLLKEQEPQETRLVHRYSRPGVYADLWLYCEVCGGKVDDDSYPKFCPNCGRKVKERE